MLGKSSLSQAEKDKWMKAMVMDMMSSEESEGESIAVKALPWRSKRVEDFIKMIDDQADSQKSLQAKRQSKNRVLAGVSSRPKPTCLVVPSWCTN